MNKIYVMYITHTWTYICIYKDNIYIYIIYIYIIVIFIYNVYAFSIFKRTNTLHALNFSPSDPSTPPTCRDRRRLRLLPAVPRPRAVAARLGRPSWRSPPAWGVYILLCGMHGGEHEDGWTIFRSLLLLFFIYVHGLARRSTCSTKVISRSCFIAFCLPARKLTRGAQALRTDWLYAICMYIYICYLIICIYRHMAVMI